MNDYTKNSQGSAVIIKILLFCFLLFGAVFLWVFFAKESATKVVTSGEEKGATQVVQLEPYVFLAEVSSLEAPGILNLTGLSEISALNFSVKNVSEESLYLDSLKFYVDASGECEKITSCMKDAMLKNGNGNLKGGFSSANFIVFQNLKKEISKDDKADFSLNLVFKNQIIDSSTTMALSLKNADISVLDSNGNEVEVKGEIVLSEY